MNPLVGKTRVRLGWFKIIAPTAPKVGIVSLGCPKALVDSERILTKLYADGYEVSGTYDGADVVIVNTCGFLNSAKRESFDAIGEALDKNGRVIVTGCMGNDANAIRDVYPSVLAVSGPHQYEAVVEAVHSAVLPEVNSFQNLVPPEGLHLTPRHYAYLKISEGCNHRCSFCIIPHLRGKLASRPVDKILEEAERLVVAGTKEILVISQDTGAYGVDMKHASNLWRGEEVRSHIVDLVSALGELDVWIRLHYVYPYPHIDEIIPKMAEGRILPYLDIPFQHASSRVLKLMRRPANQGRVLERIKAWRNICPDLTIRSTFIVGFPGETEDEFSELLGWLEEAELDRVGCFKYEDVDGAEANFLSLPVDQEIKEERWERLMKTQRWISRKKMKAKIGQTMEVIVDDVIDDTIIGRTKGDAPEIDGTVTIKSGQCVMTGDIIEVEITSAGDYDLLGKLVN